MHSETVLGLPNYEIIGMRREEGMVKISARYTGPIACPHCAGSALRSKGRYRAKSVMNRGACGYASSK